MDGEKNNDERTEDIWLWETVSILLRRLHTESAGALAPPPYTTVSYGGIDIGNEVTLDEAGVEPGAVLRLLGSKSWEVNVDVGTTIWVYARQPVGELVTRIRHHYDPYPLAPLSQSLSRPQVCLNQHLHGGMLSQRTQTSGGPRPSRS